MTREVLIIREPQIRAALDMPSTIDAVEAAFHSYSAGDAELPPVIHLDMSDHEGEIHIKAGYLHGAAIYACKFASGFPGNDALGMPANDGVVLAFDAATGALRAFLFDNGCITDIRTGAAGGVAIRYLAPAVVETVAIIGTGGQVRQQSAALMAERSPTDVRLWGRDATKAAARVAELREMFPEVDVSAAPTVADAVEGAELVITVTASREALVTRDMLGSRVTIVAVGSDGPGKQELDPQILRDATLVVTDATPQCLERGELQHAAELAPSAIELGALIDQAADRDGIVVCDLTGVGVQDVAAAALVLERIGERAERLEI